MLASILLRKGNKLTQCPIIWVLPLAAWSAEGKPTMPSSCPVCVYIKTSKAVNRVVTKLHPNLTPVFLRASIRDVSKTASKRSLLKVLSGGLGKSVGNVT